MSKMGSKKRKDVSELEMINTGDSKLFQGGAGQKEQNSQDFAQPKGVQTRAAIANHLAKKLKISSNDPKEVFE